MYNSADLSEFTCSLCFQPFEDKPEKLPRLLPDCGHTFCSKCIINLLEKTLPNMPFLCPDDQVEISISKKEITYFPKNFALLKLLEKKKQLSVNQIHKYEQKPNEKELSINESLMSVKEEDNPPQDKTTKENSRMSLNDKSMDLKEQQKSFIEEQNSHKNMCETKEEIKDNQKRDDYTNSQLFAISQTKKICPEHQRKLEVICIDHQTRICTNCALFGFHKNHNIKPEDDVLLEITNRAESLLNLFQEIDQNQKNIDSEDFFNFYKSKIKEKEYELFDSINGKFEELISKIKSQQDKLINELHQKFEDLSERFKFISGSHKELNDKIYNWKSLASKMLNNLTEKSEKDEIAFEFLPNMSYPQIDIIKRGESIYLEQELSKDNSTKLLSETLKNIKISLKENCFHFLDSFCRIDTTFAQDILKKWNDLSSNKPKNSSNTSFFPNTFKFEKHLKNPSEDKTLKFEDNSKPIKTQTYNDNIKSQGHELNANFLNDHDDENDLLSSELINFTLTEFQDPTNQPTLTTVLNKNSSDNSIVYSNNNSHVNTSSNNGQNASGFGNLTPIRSMNEISVPGNTQKVLTESVMNNQPQKRLPLSNEKQIRGNTPNTDRKLFMNEANANNVNGSKLYKKKTKFVIGEKFEHILEGFKKDNIEIVDFTGAELGDLGLQNISEFIKTSKNMKSLKLLKNKITNEGVPILLKALAENTSLISLNLAQNLLSDKVLDQFSSFFQTNHSIKLLCLNQNNINVRNAKNKVADFKKLGITPEMNKVQDENFFQNQLDPQAQVGDQNQDGCYQNSMQTCGACCGFLRTWLPVPFCCVNYPYQEVEQSYEGLLQRFGKYVTTVKPGLQYMNPCTEEIVKIDMKTHIIDLAKQVILTKDNISITIDASVYFRIIDSKKATYRVKNIRDAVQFLTFSSLRNTCGQHILQDLLEKRLEVTSTIRKNVEEHVDEWGVKIDNIFIKDILLSNELQYSLSSAAKERRIAESKIISAKADVEAAKLMKEAADILDNKAAMQIRYLETLSHITKSNNSRLIFLPSGPQGELDHKITQGLLT